MTAQQIFNRVLSLMILDSTEINNYKTNFINTLNMILGENFDRNNVLRQFAGLSVLTEIPTITTLTDVVDYDKRFTSFILPYGIAGQLLIDDNTSLSTQYLNKYEYERENIKLAQFEEITDEYSDTSSEVV